MAESESVEAELNWANPADYGDLPQSSHNSDDEDAYDPDYDDEYEEELEPDMSPTSAAFPFLGRTLAQQYYKDVTNHGSEI